jgi:hypothetical protein
MKKNYFNLLSVLFVAAILLQSCSSINKTMKEPNVRVNLEMKDFSLSEQVSAEAQTKRFLSIDWKRLFKSTSGEIAGQSNSINIASIPVIGTYGVDKTSNYALYELMKANPNYDEVMYPQFETTIQKPFLGLGFIFKKTTVKTTARLGKLTK